MLGTAMGSLLKHGSDLEALGQFLPCHSQRNDLHESGRKGGRRKSQLHILGAREWGAGNALGQTQKQNHPIKGIIRVGSGWEGYFREMGSQRKPACLLGDTGP